jgi:hypothetical protein
MQDRPKSPALTRRRFVTMVAAGSAALLASPLAASTPAPPVRRRAATAAAMTEPERVEFERQRKGTLDTLAVLRKHAMGPGTEMASVFRPLKSTRRSG